MGTSSAVIQSRSVTSESVLKEPDTVVGNRVRLIPYARHIYERLLVVNILYLGFIATVLFDDLLSHRVP